MKEYRILTAQVYHQLMAGVEECLKEGFTLVGGLCVESFKENGIRYRNFYQAIVKPDTLVFGQGVKFSEVTIQPLGQTRPTPEGVYSTPKRPPMTKDVPKVPGWYWRLDMNYLDEGPTAVKVTLEDGFWIYRCFDSYPEGAEIWPDDSVYWSAQPIMPDEMPEVQL